MIFEIDKKRKDNLSIFYQLFSIGVKIRYTMKCRAPRPFVPDQTLTWGLGVSAMSK